LESPPVEILHEPWTVADAEATYYIKAWGESFFGINPHGNISVRPILGNPIEIDLHEVVRKLRSKGARFPLLIRFQDLLQSRVVQINQAFRQAIEELGYQNIYRGVYPIKVNQLHEVVEEILEAGRPFGFGLECGSKAELIATLPHLTDDDTLLICNGYKDHVMMRLMLIGQQLGKNIIPVLEKYSEFELLLSMAKEIGVRPQFGLRVRLSTTGSGKWKESGGDHSKFGISISELVHLIQRLEEEGLTDAFKLCHFHLGSQIADIQTLKQAVKEITRVYARLHERGLGVQYIDVGGGLGVNYQGYDLEAPTGTNYTMQEYVNSVVYAVKEVCDAEEVPHPTLVSESGRAVTAHHSVLIVEALAAHDKDEIPEGYAPGRDDHEVIRELFDSLQQLDGQSLSPPRKVARLPQLLEVYHDAVEKRQQADLLFAFGYLNLEQKATAEQLYWSVIRAIDRRIQVMKPEWLPDDLDALDDHLADQYLCDFSVFQSILDHWAIDQRFPVMPIHRLDEQPTRRGTLVDLTCDSDGKVDLFVSPEYDKRFLELHPLREGEPYYLGFFLMGAYQDILGDQHNLFGRVTEAHVYADEEEPGNFYIEKTINGTTVEEILKTVQYFPNDLERRMNGVLQAKVKQGVIRPKVAVRLLEEYKAAFGEYTYLTPTTR
jgi:arginine decarboxylase